jgi:hypothetical protein
MHAPAHPCGHVICSYILASPFLLSALLERAEGCGFNVTHVIHRRILSGLVKAEPHQQNSTWFQIDSPMSLPASSYASQLVCTHARATEHARRTQHTPAIPLEQHTPATYPRNIPPRSPWSSNPLPLSLRTHTENDAAGDDDAGLIQDVRIARHLLFHTHRIHHPRRCAQHSRRRTTHDGDAHSVK